MNQLIERSLSKFHEELTVQYEVHHLLRDMVESVSLYHLQNDYLRLQENFQLTENFNTKLITRIKSIEKDYDEAQKELSAIKSDAIPVRLRFVNQIGSFLSDNRLNQKLKNRVIELEDMLSRMKPLEESDDRSEESKSNKDGKDGRKEEKESGENGVAANGVIKTPSTEIVAPPPKKPKNPLKLLGMEETPLLHIFSFLQTVEVLNYAQVCRFVYQRMDKIFGIDSATVKPEWATLPPPPTIQAVISPPKPAVSTSVSTSDSTTSSNPTASKAKSDTLIDGVGELKLTREIVDELTKRLSPQQMKVILGIAEKLKKQTSLIDMLNVEKDDLSARLQNTESVRDFLIEKLKTAELAIKSMMNETSTLKKQTASDSEIISYLDLQVQDLEGQLLEANHRCNHLQASLELQVNSLSLKEEQLSSELKEWKDKYEKMEANYKSQKKILVKEVKQLRSKVDELTQEKNLNVTRMQKLKEALDISSR